ncbi:MAG: efflux RND transporter periplasmic adaptor subunit [Caldilineaceae bacterium]|nr:efflux RND transporter periplasmic adaptor subunit [Caldilineaceae bacterium]
MYIRRSWIFIFIVLALAAGGYYYYTNVVNGAAVSAQNGTTSRAQGTTTSSATDQSDSATVAIQPATALLSEVSAAGNIALVSQQEVAPTVSGAIKTVDVKVGDTVEEGDTLLTIETVQLERAVKRAELDMEAKRNALDQLTDPATESEVAVAQANLTSAQQNLADVLDGPSADEVAAARANLASAWAKYNELEAGPSQEELTQLSANMKKAEVALAEARRAYDQIAWRNDTGMTSQAADLQDATIDYESAKAAYDESVAAADQSEVQSAIGSARSAQVTLDNLLNSPTEAEIATAQAQVADAESSLADLMDGPTESETRDAEIALEQSLVDLEEAYNNLAAATLVAPSAGTVIAIDANVGERVSEGATLVTLADTSQLELTIQVAELDLPQLAIDQSATVEIDALSGQQFSGVITHIAPSSESDSGVVYYPVTIRLTDSDLSKVRAGMTAVATIQNTETAAQDSWLVPTTAIQTQNNQSIVMVARGQETVPVNVTPGAVQGEWTLVQSPDLQAGDQVVGSVSTYLDSNSGFGRGPGGGGPPPGN